jgi:hypothetical protein
MTLDPLDLGKGLSSALSLWRAINSTAQLVRTPSDEREFSEVLDIAMSNTLSRLGLSGARGRRLAVSVRRLLLDSDSAQGLIGYALPTGYHAAPSSRAAGRDNADLSEFPRAVELLTELRLAFDDEVLRRARKPGSHLFNLVALASLTNIRSAVDGLSPTPDPDLARAAGSAAQVDTATLLEFLDGELPSLRTMWTALNVSSAQARAEQVDRLLVSLAASTSMSEIARDHILTTRFKLDAERLRMLSRSCLPESIRSHAAPRLVSMNEYLMTHSSSWVAASYEFARGNVSYGAGDFEMAMTTVQEGISNFRGDELAGAYRTLGISAARVGEQDLARAAAFEAMHLVEAGAVAAESMRIEVLEGAARISALIGDLDEAWARLALSELALRSASLSGNAVSDGLVLISRTRCEVLRAAGRSEVTHLEREVTASLSVASTSGHFKHVDELQRLLS